MGNLTRNFSLDEFTYSQTAKKLGIDNQPNAEIVSRIKRLCEGVLQPARDELERPIIVTSGYRCPQLNKAVGGVGDSYHLLGQAADLRVDNDLQALELASALLKQKICDIVIYERKKSGSWLHVQWSSTARHKFILQS